MVYIDKEYAGVKSKRSDATMKRAVKEYQLGKCAASRKKRIGSKKATRKRVYTVTINIFKAGKVFVTLSKESFITMLCTAF
jgi:hypothetical protein